MNTTQIKCFLALADTLNFTKAAARLYMTQPGLSRQIVSMEQELNAQLFIRSRSCVRLTPAGSVLAAELGQLQESADRLIQRVQTAARGCSGELSIGLLEGQWMGADLTDLLREFMENYPNIDLHVSHGSFGKLRRMLREGRIDLAFTLRFELDDMEGVAWEVFDPDTAVFAVSRRLPLGQRKSISFEDMMKETFLVISPDDCRAGYEYSMAQLKNSRGTPAKIRQAPNLPTMMLWVELGLGIGVINHRSSIAGNPEIRLIEEVPLGDASTCLVWRRDNPNPALSLFLQMIQQQ